MPKRSMCTWTAQSRRGDYLPKVAWLLTAVLALCADPRHAARVGDESKAKLLENASAPSLPPTTDVPEVPSNVSESMRNRTSPAPATTAPTTIELDSVAEVTILESAKVGGHPLALASVGADSRKRTKRVEASSGAEMDSALSEAGHGEDKTTTSGLECHLVGPCLMCGGDELDAAYCKETGRREQVRCTRGSVDIPNEEMAAAMREVDVDGGMGEKDAIGAGGMASITGFATFRSCTRTEEEEINGLVHFWLAMLAVGIVSCMGMRRRQQRGISLYDRRAK